MSDRFHITNPLAAIARIDRDPAQHSDLEQKAGLGAADATVDLVWSGGPAADHKTAMVLDPLLHLLADGESLTLSFGHTPSSAETGTHRLRLSVRAAAVGKEPVQITTSLSSKEARASFARAVEAACPGLRARPVDEIHPHGTSSSYTHRLDPAGRILDLCGRGEPKSPRGQPGLRAVDSPGVRLPLHGAPALVVEDALRALECISEGYRLDVTFTAFSLTVQEKVLLSEGLRQVRPSYPDIMEDPLGSRRAMADARLLDAWIASERGWRATCTVSLDDAAADVVPVIGTHLLTNLQPATEPRGLSLLDLTLAWPEGISGPPVLPAGAVLERLGYAGTARLAGSVRRVGESLYLGESTESEPLQIPRADLSRHMMILGATGTGKSSLIRSLLAQDIAAGLPVILIDPHGDLYAEAVSLSGDNLEQRALCADLAEGGAPFGLDLLRGPAGNQEVHANYVASQMASIFQRVLYRDVPEAFGPIWASYWRNSLLLLMLARSPINPDLALVATDGGPGLADLDRVFCDPSYRDRLLETCPDTQVTRFWRDIATRIDGEASLANITPYITGKLTMLTGNPLLRPILTSRESVLDVRAAVDAGHSILVNLAKGRTGEADAALIGALFTMQISGALLARCARPGAARPTLRIYCDEVQTYATDGLAQLLAEGRKTGAQLTLASQDLTSFGGSQQRGNWAGTALSNVGNLITFRVGPADARLLSDWYRPDGITEQTLMRLPDRVFAARTLTHGVPERARLGRTGATGGNGISVSPGSPTRLDTTNPGYSSNPSARKVIL
ncbi:MAG: helicase HerA-like domain-containing protein [Pseudomonadota bacterium]